MKVSIAAVLVHTFSFVVSTGEALGQLTEERGGGQDLDAVVDSVNAAELQQTTRYTGSLQDSEDGRSKAQGGNGGSGGRRHHNNHGPRRHQDCNNNDIAECVELLEVLTNKDLGFAATVDELNKMCPVLLNGLQCIDNYTRRCLTQKHRDYFNKLYAGTIRVIKDLCNTRGRYQEEYIRHAPCMRQVNPKYNVCSVTYHRKTVALNDMQDASVTLSEDEKNRNVIILCCSFQEYLQCSERVVFETCGNETALFTKEFLDRMAGPIVQGECSSILNMYQCPEDLFPLHPEGSPRPNSSTTDPSSSPAPQPTPTTRRPGCAKTLQDEAEIQVPAAASAPAPTPTPIPEIGMLYTHGTTQRTLTTLATLAGALGRVGEGGAAGDASPSRGPGTGTAAAVGSHTTVRSSVALHQLELDLEPVSLHEPGCVAAAEAQQSSESPREHGQHDTPADSTTSLPPLVVASTPKLVNLPPARWTEHDDTSTNGLPDPLPSSQSLHANNQSALYSSDSNMSLAYSFPRSHRLRRPARKVPHRASATFRTRLNKTRSRAGRRGGAHGPQRHISLRDGSQTLGKRQGNSSAFPWRIRHSRKHFKLPLRRRGAFRRRRPSLSRSATHTGPGYRRTTNSSKVEARPRFPIMRRRFRGSVRRERTTRRPFPDEELETNLNTDAINVSRGEESRSISYPSSNASLRPSHPVKAVPEGAIEAVPPPAVFRSNPGAGNSDARIPTDFKGPPRRRHRKPGWRRKFYRNRRPFVPGNRDGAKRRPGWRRMRRPLGAAGKKPLPPHSAETTSQNENTQENIGLEKHSLENKQEIASESVTVVSDMTRSTPHPSTTMDRETQVEWPDDAQPASLPPPTPTLGESPEAATDAPATVGETHPRVDPVLLEGSTEGLPDGATREGGRSSFIPWHGAHDDTTEPNTTTTTTTATTTTSPSTTTLSTTTSATTTTTSPSTTSPSTTTSATTSTTSATTITTTNSPSTTTSATTTTTSPTTTSPSTTISATTSTVTTTTSPSSTSPSTTTSATTSTVTTTTSPSSTSPSTTTSATTTTARSTTSSTTTATTTSEPLPSVASSPAMDKPSSSSDTAPVDHGAVKVDRKESLPEGPSSGGRPPPLDVDDLWFQNLFLSEVREAVIPAPTPVPYTVRLWQEHDKKMGGFSSRFVPLSLDIVESDFVPLTHPDATVAEKEPATDLQHEHREHSEAVRTKEPHHNLQEEPRLVEQPTLVEEPTLLEEPTLVEEPSLVAEPTVGEQLTMVEEPTLVEESNLVEQPTIHEVATVEEQPTLVEETPSGRAPPPRQPHSSTTAVADAEIGPSFATRDPAPGSGPALGGEGMEVHETLPLTTSEVTQSLEGKTADEEKEEEKEKKNKKKKEKKKDKEKQVIAPHSGQSGGKKKQNSLSPQLPVTTDDLGSHAVVPSAVPHDAQDISPGRAAATQLTSNPTSSTPVSPTVSGATSPSHVPSQPPTDVQLDDHVHAPTDTPSPTQASPDSLLSSNNSRGHGQSSESEGGAPDRPAAADSTRDDLAEAEPQGESGAGTPLLHAAVAGAVLLAVL